MIRDFFRGFSKRKGPRGFLSFLVSFKPWLPCAAFGASGALFLTSNISYNVVDHRSKRKEKMIASNLTEVRKYNDRERREWFMIRFIEKQIFNNIRRMFTSLLTVFE